MSEEIRRYQIAILKKVAFTVVTVFVFLFLLHKAVKYYDIYVEKKSRPLDAIKTRFFTAQQMHDYTKATELVLSPYLMLNVQPNFHSDTININSVGFRGPEIQPKKENVVRIVVVGGSAAMGCGATSDKNTFTALLENKLNESRSGDRTYEVINAGLASAISMQEFILISLKVIELEPDVVIIFDGFNDMVGSVINDRRPGYPWRYSELEKALNISITKAFIRKRLMNYRPTKKIIEMMEKRRLERMKTRYDYSLNLPAVKFYKTTLDRMAHLLKSYGIKPVFAYQPSLYLKTPRAGLENIIMAEYSENRIEILKDMLQRGKNAMQETARENGVPFINCIPVFNGIKEDIFYDTVHFGDKGQEILAQFLYENLKDL